jgi:hypothetical protein
VCVCGGGDLKNYPTNGQRAAMKWTSGNVAQCRGLGSTERVQPQVVCVLLER